MNYIPTSFPAGIETFFFLSCGWQRSLNVGFIKTFNKDATCSLLDLQTRLLMILSLLEKVLRFCVVI